jgi:hypothetical protein
MKSIMICVCWCGCNNNANSIKTGICKSCFQGTMNEDFPHIDHWCFGGVGAHSQNGCGWDRVHPGHLCDLNEDENHKLRHELKEIENNYFQEVIS